MTKVMAAFSFLPFLLGMGVFPVTQTGKVTDTHKVTAALADASQSAVTTNLGIYGGDNWDIAVDGDHVYTIASGVPNGFFYSTDAAATWQRPSGTNDYGSGTAVEVDLTTHAVYVALDGLFKSTDYGVTLTKIADSIGNPLLFAQGKLFATHNDTIYISSDNGATFTTATISGENIMSYAASKTAGTFYAVTRNATTSASHLYTSTDYGISWAAMTVDASVTSYTNVNANPYNSSILTLSSDNGLWLSLDAGATWSAFTSAGNGGCGTNSTWTSTRWYACSSYSTDNGAHWTAMDVHTNVMRGPGKSIVYNAADESVMYGDCMSGVCKSTDGGLIWHNSLDGITGVNVLAISTTTNKSTAWISSSNGLGKSTDFTSATPTWTWPILPCDPSARCDSSGIGEAVWVKPNNASIVMAGSIGGWVYRSTDAGTTWTAQIPPVVNKTKFKTDTWNNLRPKYFLSDPLDANVVYLAMYDPIDNNGAVLKSTDSGVTWTDLAIADDAPAIVLSMTKTGVLYAGTGYDKVTTTTKGIYKYDGASWTKLSGIDTRLNIISVMVDPEVQTTIYATASNDLAPLQLDGFFRSIDSGATWTKITTTGYSDFGAITVQKSTSPNTLYMSATDGVNHGVLLKSSDQGATWGLLYQGLKSETFSTVLFDGLVVGSKHGLFALKSKAKLDAKVSATKVKKGSAITLTGTLKDAANKRPLKSKVLGLYQLNGKTWKLIGTTKTTKTGTLSVKVKPKKNSTFRVTWIPDKKDKAEYSGSVSKNFVITIKK
jgi:hypothetical protein